MLETQKLLSKREAILVLRITKQKRESRQISVFSTNKHFVACIFDTQESASVLINTLYDVSDFTHPRTT